ncbi:Hypothetical protein, putative [Bodo saltans]|uniref:SAM domain-containing protein n=1 Tax=Bodo saltans TaxID=75058 RepID=A0A0S4JDK0_BODSA|nr:Hypothetical protein, putative [Bodo saltans]|eukprot:CUG87052.1 Hypothetical protein, putative [Bodo saltans]
MSKAPEPVVISGLVERIKKYTKKWAARFCTFDPAARKFTYSESDKENASVKAYLILTKVIRCAELREGLMGPDVFTMNLEGHLDGDSAKVEQWNMRFPNDEQFESWYEAMRRSLATAGLMEPYNYGLPPVDPRQGLPFARIPITHLFKFVLLEKAIVYSFTQLRFVDPTAVAGATNALADGVLVVGDKLLYLFRPNADVLRCTNLTNITQLHYTKGCTTVALTVKAPEADLVIQVPEGLDVMKHALSVQFRAMNGGKALPVTPIDADKKIEAIAATMRIKPDEGYKIEVASPTAKSRLKHALDQYEKQEGVTFDPNAHRAKKATEKRQNSVGLPSGSASPTGGAAAGGGGGGSSSTAGLDTTIPLVRFLVRLGLTQYGAQLLKQHVDMDVLQCMDLVDLETFGVKNKEHGQKMLDSANDAAFVKKKKKSCVCCRGGGRKRCHRSGAEQHNSSNFRRWWWCSRFTLCGWRRLPCGVVPCSERRR